MAQEPNRNRKPEPSESTLIFKKGVFSRNCASKTSFSKSTSLLWQQHPSDRAVVEGVSKELCILQGGSGTDPEPGTGTVGTVFPETESGTGTAGTFFQEPKPEPEPSFPVKLTQKPFLQRNRQNRKLEPLEPFHPARNRTEPNRGLPV